MPHLAALQSATMPGSMQASLTKIDPGRRHCVLSNAELPVHGALHSLLHRLMHLLLNSRLVHHLVYPEHVEQWRSHLPSAAEGVG